MMINQPDAIVTPRKPQVFGRYEVRLFQSVETGLRVAKILDTTSRRHSERIVPLDVMRLAAGKDQWMRGVVCKCSGCDTRAALSNMEDGLYCLACTEAQQQENARLDGRDE